MHQFILIINDLLSYIKSWGSLTFTWKAKQRKETILISQREITENEDLWIKEENTSQIGRQSTLCIYELISLQESPAGHSRRT